ncbi:aminotransferase class I/II-fold pyridoxal phosphate-dependent enzyme [Falsiruegeria mediterranea]|uniref:8-amino-3,8-dideoxy-alpha-D-manno-octulosonate transaminase n=1 Tax=Falsiruegeria mediterranea M17 TaxID=1200281 RepID=A0A2R8CFF7_9RHOB|nr:aminotransferase class I/II-fold pyridoxal phosphate-dependent enzyme [Falsiruegeria mediterranea]SPJ31151.1 8-amino-3,8-dideoxy-alpha-D-manno-octulosonate transaminase [Falsiruegeria mediterranea M17]
MARLGMREWMAVGRVMANGPLTRTERPGGPCDRFEDELAQFAGCQGTLAVSSGTAALISALQACEIGPGDEVLVPAYTWMASAGAVLHVGAVPVLVEIDTTLTIDTTDLASKITPRSRAIIPVHMLNRPCDLESILSIARTHDLKVIEDACQAVGIRYQGQVLGTFGDMGTFSFNQHKNMTCGEGGAILTNDPDLLTRARNAHDMGLGFRQSNTTDPDEIFLGNNFRLNEMQGAILRVQLRKLQSRIDRMTRRVEVMADQLGWAGYPVAPLHDDGPAASLVLTFDTELEAVQFSERRGARRLFDTSKHVYTEWGPILTRKMAHPGITPWAWAGHPNGPGPDSCPKTLDLLKRSCTINAMPDVPLPIVRYLARKLAA